MNSVALHHSPSATARAEKLASAVAFIEGVRSNLMHQRLFGVDGLGDWRRACTNAEGDVEEWLQQSAAREAAMSTTPLGGDEIDIVLALMARIKMSTMHQRQFGGDTMGHWRSTCTEAEGEIWECSLRRKAARGTEAVASAAPPGPVLRES